MGFSMKTEELQWKCQIYEHLFEEVAEEPATACTLLLEKMVGSLTNLFLFYQILLGLLLLLPCPSSSLPLCTDLSKSLFHTYPSFVFA